MIPMRLALVLISADSEWRAVRALYPGCPPLPGRFSETFVTAFAGWQARFLHGGWGKIAAAASAQHAIDRYQPDLLVNLGTCGGFSGCIERGEIVLAERTLVYDIYEQMGDPQAHIAHYATQIDLSCLSAPHPHPVRRGLLLSGDRDLLAEEAPALVQKYQAAAGDWESGAVAWAAQRNNLRLLILRGVTDLVEAGAAPPMAIWNISRTPRSK
ncbi:MAG: hypothetical protein M5U05_12085 [Anaerolineales bacterium]|jgi:adenosylhomocysteine nucleosidase|nr:hypothetical protein [Anaerolineales bacterium]